MHMYSYLKVVGNISGAYKNTVPKEPVIPNFPIILNVIINGRRLVPLATSDNMMNQYKCSYSLLYHQNLKSNFESNYDVRN